MNSDRWRRVTDAIKRMVESGEATAIAVSTGSADGPESTVSFGFGSASAGMAPGEHDRVNGDKRFVVASITKPVIAAAVLHQLEQGRLTLGDRVSEYLPEFGRAGKAAFELRHLLTHTSGLPDLPINNRELRERQAGLEEFVQAACDAETDFPAGRGVQYSSLGYAILGRILERVSGQTNGELLEAAFFGPLGMRNSRLGGPDDVSDSRPVARIAVPPDQVDGDDWNWNSRYWRECGAPWGGMISTANDLARWAEFWLGDESGERLHPHLMRRAGSNQLLDFPDLPAAERATRPWGLGWRLNWPNHPWTFGDLASSAAFGHWGATGTLMWIDPARRIHATILTSTPINASRAAILQLSNLIAASWLPVG